ncbi:MAG: TIGR02391 family protein [Candidatus Dormibacteraeota bacterium]|nr:TIGR02391 family protein [Candidatus Dormibacteraeota bacterium]
MHFDDVQILRLIDEYEQTATAYIYNGFVLLNAIAGGRILEIPNDYRQFARELLIAREAELVTFEELVGAGYRPLDPRVDAHMWLQQIGEIRLTIAGRDRARGRLILLPPPDPDEDDGRPIAYLTLENVAREIGDTYSAAQLQHFLTDSKIPQSYVPDVTAGTVGAEYVVGVLQELERGACAARRILRAFLGAWLSGALHSRPSDKSRAAVLRYLNQQGWHLRDGRLVVGEASAGGPEQPEPGSRAERIGRLHPRIGEIADRYPHTLEVAVQEAFKSLMPRVRSMTGLTLDGTQLMAKAFADDGPLRIADPRAKEAGSTIQEGYRFLFMGAVLGMRNPGAHHLLVPMTDDEAFEELGFASLLMRELDGVEGALPVEDGGS